MDEPILNAIVTLRNEVSPWLMILQVVPDGWELPDYVPGHFTALGLPGSASRCLLAEPEISPADPEKLIKRVYCIASSPANREFLEFYVALVPGGALEKAWGYKPNPDNTHVFMCGSPQMSEEMLKLLSQEGFNEDRKNEPGQVHVEKYWQL